MYLGTFEKKNSKLNTNFKEYAPNQTVYESGSAFSAAEQIQQKMEVFSRYIVYRKENS